MRANSSRYAFTVLQLFSITMVLVAVVLVALARFTTVYGLPDFQTRFATSEEEHSRGHDRVLVNLGYATYAGVRNESTGLKVFKG